MLEELRTIVACAGTNVGKSPVSTNRHDRSQFSIGSAALTRPEPLWTPTRKVIDVPCLVVKGFIVLAPYRSLFKTGVVKPDARCPIQFGMRRGHLEQTVRRLEVNIASQSTDVGRLVRSYANLVGNNILCKKRRGLSIPDETLEFFVFWVPFAD